MVKMRANKVIIHKKSYVPVKTVVKKVKSVRFFCSICGKRIWEKMPKEMKKWLTIKEAENTAFCSNCIINWHIKNSN